MNKVLTQRLLKAGDQMKENDKGFTLVEVLAASVILSIVITGFLSFFVHSMAYTSQTEEKLNTATTARMVLTILEDQGKAPFIDEHGSLKYENLDLNQLSTYDEEIIEVFNGVDLSSYEAIIAFELGPNGLIQAKVEIENSHASPSSRSKLYTYLR